MVAGRLGFVTQPILGRLREDFLRQGDAFLRVQRLLRAACVPLAVLRLGLAESFFTLALATKWAPAVSVFQALSVMYGFNLAISVGMACLRAQGRFATLFAWQAVQLVVSAAVCYVAVSPAGALGAALATAGTWAISAVVVIGLCVRSWRRALGAAFRVSGAPWGACLLVFGARLRLRAMAAQLRRDWQVIALLVGPMLFLAALALQVALHRELRQPAADALRLVAARIEGCRRRRHENAPKRFPYTPASVDSAAMGGSAPTRSCCSPGVPGSPMGEGHTAMSKDVEPVGCDGLFFPSPASHWHAETGIAAHAEPRDRESGLRLACGHPLPTGERSPVGSQEFVLGRYRWSSKGYAQTCSGQGDSKQ